MGNHHSHAHSHDQHDHHHGTGNIQVAFWLNFFFCLVEFAGGIYTNSIAILSDALHDLGDSFALGLAWYFQKLSSKSRDSQFSYGYKRFSLLGALINSVVLLIGSIFVLWEAIPRLLHPEPSNAKGMIAFAVIGILINGAAIFRLKKGASMNEKVISLHLLEDVLGWVAVLITAVVMLFVDVPVLDPLLSILITGYILFNIYRNLKQSLRILLQAVPSSIDEEALKKELTGIDKVVDVHDVHIWTMDGNFNVISLHLVTEDLIGANETERIKSEARHILHHAQIQHSTIEIESQSQETQCRLRSC